MQRLLNLVDTSTVMRAFTSIIIIKIIIPTLVPKVLIWDDAGNAATKLLMPKMFFRN
jgi:hypothetical protein